MHSRNKLKSWIRITLFIIFVILVLSPVIVWSFSWALLAALLFIFALKGSIELIRNKAGSGQSKRSTRVWKIMITAVALLIAMIPPILFPQYREPEVTGEYEVRTAVYTYTDPNRIEEFTDTGDNRFVNVKFWYPGNAGGTYPLVVFSHGAYGVRESNTSTFTELASHGYVVVSIDHPYHSFYTQSADGKITMINADFLREVNDSNKDGIYTIEELYGLTQKWMKLRTGDMNFVIDTILEKAGRDQDPVYQLINTEQIGVFGHSMGGAASEAVGRERSDVDAVVNLDAPFFRELVYDREINDLAAKDEPYRVPLLNIYTDDVWRQLGKNSAYAANVVNNPNFKDAYTVHFQGAKHLSVTDLPLFSPVLANMLQKGPADIDQYYCIETMNELVLQFFDFTLKGRGEFSPHAEY
ncbi:alpha/beta hydrolase [Paenibacillus sp. MMS20-IR301]|uniref:alpha/beta hydrolase family protein n=1 Tax=Paenibacillus sp. MMS20-IR301 TaxID=2895946 RepID=UPI0028F14247|nr:alpha/beta hydrolase [Paenibacillus sp. MMS20-IR301]WNS42403.1 alpha/beta hydrolase [Paenibacillus sp. MMS20-IR301]